MGRRRWRGRLARLALAALVPACVMLAQCSGASRGAFGSADSDDGGAGLTLMAQSATERNSSPAASIAWIVTSIALVISVAAIGLAAWESPPDHLVGYLRTLGRGPTARGLYLPLRLARGEGGQQLDVAYLRELTPRSAGLLTEQPLVRGEHVRLALGALPGYPHPGATVPGVVTRVARFRSAEWVYARIRLVEARGPERQSMREFVERLAYHAAGQPA